MNNMTLGMFLATLLLIGLGMVWAADTDATSATEHFNPKINAWAEGTVMTVDADGAKFTIRGTKRPYATAYAKMLKEIHDKTAKLSGEAAARKDAEIRTSWDAALRKASQE